MDVSYPYLALLSRVSGATLHVLGRTTAPMTGRQIARLAGASQPAVQAALTHLVEHGLVDSQPAGRANLYALNREHIAIPAVEAALGMRATLVDRLRELVARWSASDPDLMHLSLFGSAARGDGDTHSDIDLFIVRRDSRDADDSTWRSRIVDLQNRVERWTGNRAAPIDVSWAELRQMSQGRARLLVDVRRDGIRVFGCPIDELLRQEVRAVQAGDPADATR